MGPRRAAVAVGVACALAVTAACSSSGSAPRETESAGPAQSGPSGSANDCPVTSSEPESSPPAALATVGQQWYGTGGLWVNLGNFADSVPRQDGVLSIKHPWWTADSSGEPVSENGPPVVSAQPVDGGETVEGSSGAYAEAESEGESFSWWPTTLGFPSEGCWQITGEWEGDTVTAVVLVTESATE